MKKMANINWNNLKNKKRFVRCNYIIEEKGIEMQCRNFGNWFCIYCEYDFCKRHINLETHNLNMVF